MDADLVPGLFLNLLITSQLSEQWNQYQNLLILHGTDGFSCRVVVTQTWGKWVVSRGPGLGAGAFSVGLGMVSKEARSCFSPMDWALQLHGASEIPTNPKQLPCKCILSSLLILSCNKSLFSTCYFSGTFTTGWEFQTEKWFGCREKGGLFGVRGMVLYENGRNIFKLILYIQFTNCFYIYYFIWFLHTHKKDCNIYIWYSPLTDGRST